MIFKRYLFWKIFVAFWVASLLVVFAATFVFLEATESHHYKMRQQQVLETIAAFVIQQHEAGQPIPRRSSRWQHHLPRSAKEGINKVMYHQPIQIYQGEQLIFERKPHRKRVTFEYLLSLTGDAGVEYQVFAPKQPPPALVLNIVKRLHRLQLLFILIVSALVSFLLSWTITRPLKKLGAYSRAYASAELDAELDKKLLKRRDEIGQLARDFEAMVAELENNIAGKQQLLHDVSHELRAPLTRLQAAAGLLEQQGEQLATERIHRECERMDCLIQQILNFSRMEQQYTEPETVELSALLQQLLDNLQLEYPQRSIRFQAPVTPISLAIYPDLLSCALENILRNACKYSPDDQPIDVVLKQLDGELQISVCDYGEGIADDDREALLKPFYRSGNQMHSEGFGLGLSIAKRAVDKHRGRLVLKNHPGGGLQVLLNLPLSQ